MTTTLAFHSGSFSLEADLARLRVALREGLTEAALVYQSRILEATSAHCCATRCGAASGNLNGNLVKLGWVGLVPDGVLALAHCVRRLGNEARHLKRALEPVDADLGAAGLEQWLGWYLPGAGEAPLVPIPQATRTLARQVVGQQGLDLQALDRTALEASPALPALVAEALLGRNQLTETEAVLSPALARFPEDGRLRQMEALWLRRGGHLAASLAKLGPLHAEDPRDEETLGIYGGSLKAAWREARAAGEEGRARKLLEQATRLYQEGWKRSLRDAPKDPNLYLGINAAATALWAGQGDRAAQEARAILQVLESRAAALGASAPQAAFGFWDQATRAEALLLCGQTEAALAAVAALEAAHPDRVGDLRVLRTQLDEHRACLP